ncbi:hypothetical protein KILIM_019_00560 [Kineosphaera limosa NBRC 100340]|uniref:Uncharacterized protein n=2 Tax=Kineosphaera TaxID=211469 RepID=K6VGU3_9MICO|nr:hypothetical protein KILIM_019_00560 [Kineosphaera limosa NBRC 100340]
MWRRWRAFTHADARRDGVPTWLADVIWVTPIVGTLLLGALYLTRRDAYYAVLREDWPVEWAQFALLLFIAVLATITAARIRKHGALIVGLLLTVALGALALAGEEISWAQRALAFGTPPTLSEVNQQSEFNIHNIQSGSVPLQSIFKLFSFVLAVAGVTLALLTRGPRPRLQGAFWSRLAVPSYTIVGSLTMIGYWAVVVVAPISPVVRYQEWAEVSLYLALAGYVYAIFARHTLRGSGPVIAGRPTRDPIDTSALVALAVVVALTVVLAALTAYHGIIPENAPEVRHLG